MLKKQTFFNVRLFFKGCDCIIVDDMIDTAGTLCEAAAQLKLRGAKVALLTFSYFFPLESLCFCDAWFV